MGHTYSARIRVTPPAGDATVYDLSAFRFVTVGQPSYSPVFVDKEMIDRSMKQVRYGYRAQVVLEFAFSTPSSNETTLADDILTRAMDDEYTIELSLDSGTTYREVQLAEFNQEPMAGKNVGILQSTVWTVKELLTSKPAVASGSW